MDIRVWGRDGIDDNTIEQAERAARSPVVAGPLALMPDAHIGIGATIGSVIVTENAIIPAAVGVDIGCGMVAAETDLVASDLPDTLDPLVGIFGRAVPAGVGRGRDVTSGGRANQAVDAQARRWMEANPNPNGMDDALANRAYTQLGTLGSGNHFLEVCLDEEDRVWLVLHSGSRGVGNRLASEHIKLAKAQEQAVEDPDLAYFLDGTPEFRAYVQDMLWSQDYAAVNRGLMMTAAQGDFFEFVGKGQVVRSINCHHNFAVQEEHDGRLLWVTRKGAIRALRGDAGVIPGSMGTRSYIVEGLGEPLSYTSASHGAGRRMSRGQARRQLSQESLVEAMEGKAWNADAKSLLDEHPSAYKDIDAVMEAQKDLVTIQHTLRQVVNYKGL